jgi:hypothetical protein
MVGDLKSVASSSPVDAERIDSRKDSNDDGEPRGERGPE